MTDEKRSFEQALDLLVFAPVGLVLTARSELPELVAKGRARLEGQVSVARFVGQFAVKQGKVEVEKRLRALTDPPAPAAPTVSVPLTLVAEPTPATSDPSTTPASPAPAEPGTVVAPAPSAADLAIPGYDALSASQVVQRLAGLAPAELEQVRVYEASTRGRKTVLTKVSQLQ